MKYFLGFLAAVGLIVLVFILLLRSFGDRTPESTINLLSYANTETIVRLSVDGPVTADQTHRGYRITVGRSAASIETTVGYEGEHTYDKSYDNNVNAYATFLRAIDLQGFTKGSTDPARADDRGVCPDGDRYAFEIVRSGKVTQRFWSSTCGKGTYGGNSALTRQLFLRQIPEANNILSKFGPRGV